MQLHQIQTFHKLKKARRVGRGGKRGTYSGRGTKGQRARAGARIRPAVRDVIKRIPKLRGYKFRSFQAMSATVNLADIGQIFEEGDTVSPLSLNRAGLIRKIKGRFPSVKILGRGDLKKKIIFRDVKLSRNASGKIK